MPNKPFKFYLHNNYDRSEIAEQLREEGYPEHLIEGMSTEIYSKFYEVGFEVSFTDTGKITETKPL